MTDSGKPRRSVAELDAELAGLSIEGFWKTIGAMPAEPRPHGAAFLWRWRDVYPKLFEAAEIIDLGEGAERRSLRLCTPGASWTATTDTIHAAIQMVLPGEVARAHRHSAAAFRFVIEGDGGYTTVDGERYHMEAADLVLTPQGTWHDHGNLGERPIIWMDVLDFPFVRMLNAIFYEAYNDETQSVVYPDGHGRRAAGPVRPLGSSAPRAGLAYHYKGVDSLAALRALGTVGADPYDGATVEYVDPLAGGRTLPTKQCRLHRLAPGQRTRRHRHTWNTIYHVVEGAGQTVAGEKVLAWGPHDTFSLPAWNWHEHHCGPAGEAILFSVTDEPILKAFALDRMEEWAA